MPKDSVQPTRTFGYSLNVFPSETLEQLWSCLQNEALAIKESIFPDSKFPVELRFSQQLVTELQSSCEEVARLKHYLDTREMDVITINGFVMDGFQNQRVKENVFLPAWHESDRRTHFTNACLDLLAQIVSFDQKTISVSAPFGALKPVSMKAVSDPILKSVRYAADLSLRTGVRCTIALEPEPGLTVETTPEVIEFFNQYIPQNLRAHVGVTFDLSHQLVQFENLGEAVRSLQKNNIAVEKVHVSNAAEMSKLKPFYHDSNYLHQVCGIDAKGTRSFFSLDWPEDRPSDESMRYRIHYHLPVNPSLLLPVGSTIREVEQFLTQTVPTLDTEIPLIIETYTWPEQIQSEDQICQEICGELKWVRNQLGNSITRGNSNETSNRYPRPIWARFYELYHCSRSGCQRHGSYISKEGKQNTC